MPIRVTVPMRRRGPWRDCGGASRGTVPPGSLGEQGWQRTARPWPGLAGEEEGVMFAKLEAFGPGFSGPMLLAARCPSERNWPS